jgi:shikimate dehydrogenase
MIDSQTQLYCIFGSPVRHSLSPIMHNAAFRCRGINAVYLAFEPSSGKDAMQAMRALPMAGASITIPFKASVIPFLDHIDTLAKNIGAVNTVKFGNLGLEGFNTDGLGALGALEEKTGPVSGKKILLLGTGGSSRAIAFTLCTKGALLSIAGRKSESHQSLMNDLTVQFNNIKSYNIGSLTSEDISSHEVIINSTPLGMHDSDALPINTDILTPDHTVFDIVYRPHETPLLKAAHARGSRVVYGIEMLIRQGAAQFTLWTDAEPPVEVMREELMKAVYHS